jgi:UDP-glucose 4-epimerase
MQGKKIVVTGGGGFLGSHVVPLLLEKGNDVVVLDDFSNGKMEHLAPVEKKTSLKIIRGDITNIENVRTAFKNCDVAIHLAVLDLRQSIKEPQRVSEVIVKGTLNCLDVAIDSGIELFVNCSSTEVYGSAQSTPMDENHPLSPTNPYAASKVAQDMYVQSYGVLYGLPWVTLRPSNMYGPNSYWHGFRAELIPRMIIRAMNRKPLVVFGNGQQSRDFTYVKDTAGALVETACVSTCRSKCLNCCTGIETTVLQVAEIICKQFDLDPDKFVQRYDSRPGDVMRHHLSNEKLKENIGFVPETNLETGIAKTIDWFKALPVTAEELIKDERIKNWE